MTNKRVTSIILIVIMLVTSGWLLAQNHQSPDCEKIKESCNRKKGCKCQLNCDERGRRLPPMGGWAECPSYCCEDKCDCHPMGCP